MEHLLRPEILGSLIPIIAIIMGIGIGMLSIFLKYRKRKEMFALHHLERMAAIEKGVELPPMPEGFFTDDIKPPKPRSPHQDLKFCIFLVAIGLALLIALHFNGKGAVALYALLPIFWGLGGVIYRFTLGKKEVEIFDAEQKAKAAAEASRLTTPQ